MSTIIARADDDADRQGTAVVSAGASSIMYPVFRLAVAGAALGGLAALGLWNYVVFHSLVELFGIAVAIAIFLVAWNVRQRIDNDFLLVVALVYAAAALLDLLHTLAYPGMGAIPGATIDPPTQLWIAARYLQAIGLLMAPIWMARRLPLKAAMASFVLIDAMVFLTIFHPWPWLPAFPKCHLGASGLTSFKVVSEYFICGILLAAVWLLWLRRARLDKAVFGYMAASFLVTMASEISFTSYVNVQAPSNMIGHLLKAVAVFLAYKALLEAGLKRPYDVLFRDLADSERRFRLLTDATFEGIAVTEQGRFVDCNDQLARMLGYSREEIIGRDIASIVAPADRQRVLDSIHGGRETSEEQELVRKDGSVRYVEVHGQDASIGERRLRYTAIHDITDRKRDEVLLRQTAEELARSNKELEQFAYVASHDLQEPLRTVRGFVQLLQQKYSKQLDADADTFIEHAINGTERMQALIADLLAYARVGTHSREPVLTDATDAFRQALGSLTERINETEAEITHGQLPTVLVDPSQLAQLFQNLLGNAMKFRGDARPKIHVDACREGDHWHISVSDNGIGIDPQYHQKVFEVFRRLHSRQQYEGTGIGLAICKKIVERQGGRMWVESLAGQGSTFHFTLPK